VVAFLPALLIFALIPSSEVMALIDSPCKRICVFKPHAGVCLGCGRTLDEISRWTMFTAAERSRIMDDLPRRLAALGDLNTARQVVRG
jgi:uncharacterized protein